MIFCVCGQGNAVPWESNADEPAPQPVEVPPAPKLVPVKFEAPPPPPMPRPSRTGPRDPNACLNHEERAKSAVCAECGEAFCATCLITLQGTPLCGPCKNQRVRALQKAGPTSSLAVLSLCMALAGGPLAFCLVPMGRTSALLGYLAILPQLLALALGIVALRRIESQEKLGGRAMAWTGVAAAGVTGFLIVLLNWYAPKMWT